MASREPSDEELMRRYADRGDRAAFEALFRRFAPRLLAYFRRTTRSDTTAQDLTQQTFLQLHRARRDYRRGAAVRPWLFTIASNVRRDHVRRTLRRPEQALEADRHPEPSVAPATTTARERVVRRAVEALPEGQREVLLLHWYEGLSFPEIARALGLGTSAVKVRAHRAYKALRLSLSGPPTDPGS